MTLHDATWTAGVEYAPQNQEDIYDRQRRYGSRLQGRSGARLYEKFYWLSQQSIDSVSLVPAEDQYTQLFGRRVSVIRRILAKMICTKLFLGAQGNEVTENVVLIEIRDKLQGQLCQET